MNKHLRLCIIGEVIVDVTLKRTGQENKLRFGGIFHAARALWAMGFEYDLLYIAPAYLKEQIDQFAVNLGASKSVLIGEVIGAPNIILINEATESGDQGYELLLREEYKCKINSKALSRCLKDVSYSDVVIFPGSYELNQIFDHIKVIETDIHIDIANGIKEINQIAQLGKQFQTIITSTSSKLFLETYNGSPKSLCKDVIGKYCLDFIFKENRGGTRLFQHLNPNDPIEVDAHVRPIVHSVGVGDCFNMVFVALKNQMSKKCALTYASWIAAEYASTTFPDDFKRECNKVLAISQEDIVKTPGVFIPWEKRPFCNIYIAGPDFDFVDTSEIRTLFECLRYHNFSPRLPVQENGQMKQNANKSEKQEMFIADMNLLNECQILVAVLLYNDPGTLIEIGLAAGFRMPVFVYDPKMIAENLMLTELPKTVSSDLDVIIGDVFTSASKIIENEIR